MMLADVQRDNNKPKRRRSRKYSSRPIAPPVPDEASLGPKMAALNERQRKFVMELVYGPVG
jgi:hypothetical protein